MNIEEFREYCLALPHTTEDTAFGDEHLLLRVFGKIFACIDFERADYFVVKCHPGYATELRERYHEIEPAWHWNKKYWNQIHLSGTLSDELIKSMIRHSYSEVVKKLPRKTRAEYPEITTVQGVVSTYI